MARMQETGLTTHKRMIRARGVQISENGAPLKKPVAEFLGAPICTRKLWVVSQKAFNSHQGLAFHRFGSLPKGLLDVIANVCVIRIWGQGGIYPT
jgi:hypothetical protein